MIRHLCTLFFCSTLLLCSNICASAAADNGSDLPRWVYEPPAGVVSEVGTGESWLEAFADGLVHLGQAIHLVHLGQATHSVVRAEDASSETGSTKTFNDLGRQTFGVVLVQWKNQKFQSMVGLDPEPVDESSSEIKLVRFERDGCSYELKFALLNQTCGEGEGAGDLTLTLNRSGCTLGDLLQSLAKEGVTVAEEERTVDGRFFLLLTDSNGKRYETSEK